MRTGTILATVSAIALAAGTIYWLRRDAEITSPPTMSPVGEATSGGIIVKKRTIDYEAIIKSTLADKASFLTLTLAQDIVRDQHLETSIRYTRFPKSRGRVRVKYQVEYPIGYVLNRRRFSVSGNGDTLVLTLSRPRLIARPSVRLTSYQVLDSGYFVDEKTALLKLQQRIQPETERRATRILRRADIISRSERALRGFLEPILKQQADGDRPPKLEFRYR